MVDKLKVAYTLETCPEYSPDWVAMEDPNHCGHPASAHDAGLPSADDVRGILAIDISEYMRSAGQDLLSNAGSDPDDTTFGRKCIDAANKMEGLEADLEAAVRVAFEAGATEWVRMNYPGLYARFTDS